MELTRQTAPPTKNDHAPPPIESRKSSQSVLSYPSLEREALNRACDFLARDRLGSDVSVASFICFDYLLER